MTSRRDFLIRAAAAAAGVVAGAWPAYGAPRARGPARGRNVVVPEHGADLSGSVLVYDAIAPAPLFAEVLAVLAAFPAGARVVVLASPARADEARARFAAAAPGALERVWDGVEPSLRRAGTLPEIAVVAVDDSELWTRWPRDLWMPAWAPGGPALVVPWQREARRREDLVRDPEPLAALARHGLPRADFTVRGAPLAFEGGNLLYDVIDGSAVLFAGNDVVLETMRAYRDWFGMTRSVADVVAELKACFGVARVELLGRTDRRGEPVHQARLVWHLDMALALLAGGNAVVPRFDWSERHRTEAHAALDEELRAGDSPQRDAERYGTSDSLTQLDDAAADLDAIRRRLRALGYRVHDLATDWRRVLRHQSHTNVLLGRDRVVMPLFPDATEPAPVTQVTPGSGRRVIAIPEPQPPASAYTLTGANRAAFETYRKLGLAVRTVPDRFHLAGGNLHCVFGRLP